MKSNLQRHRLQNVFVVATLVSLVCVTQWTHNCYQRDLATHPDEVAHFLTGILCYDYLAQHIGESPMKVAEEFYVRYPKLGLGQWPPLLYLVEAAWFSGFGVSRTSVMVLMAAIAIVTGLLLYQRVSAHCGPILGLAASVLLLTNPVVTYHYCSVMPELLLCLCGLLAYSAAVNFFTGGRPRWALTFCVWTLLAVMTKGNGLALLLFAGLAPIAGGKIGLIFRWRTVVLAAVFLSVALPFYVFIIASGIYVQSNVMALLSGVGEWYRRVPYLSPTRVCSVVVLLFAVIGAIGAVFARQRDAVTVECRMAIAWFSSILLFHALAPVPVSGRYLLPLTVPIGILFAHGLKRVVELIEFHPAMVKNGGRTMMLGRLFSFGFVAVVTGSSMATTPSRTQHANVGYRTAANSIGYLNPYQVILISADPRGEGGFIAERAMHNRGRSGFVLRASKALAKTNWNDSRYQLRYGTMQELRDFLRRLPVHFVVMDGYGDNTDHHKLLQTVIDSDPATFPLLHSATVRRGKKKQWQLRIYENLAARGRTPEVISVDMTHNLGYELQVRLRDPKQN